jgi:tetratricopeptide (TPR) repeat protein
MDLRRYDAARQEALALLGDDPDDVMAHLLLGETLLKSGDFAGGREAASNVIHRAPDWGWGYWLMGRSWLLDARPKSAAADPIRRFAYAQAASQRALECDPAEPAFYMLAASVALDSGNPQLGLELAERGLALEAQSPELHFLRGLGLVRLQRPDDALTSFATALEHAPDEARSHREVAEILLARGEYAQAGQRMREALRLNPNDRYAYALMLKIAPTQHWALGLAVWIYDVSALLRGPAFFAWLAVNLLLAPIVLRVTDRFREFTDVLLAGWILVIFAPLATFALPAIVFPLWLFLVRDPLHASLSRQERLDRTIPGLAIVLALPTLALGIALESIVPIEYFLTALTAIMLQATGAIFEHRWLRRLFFVAAGLYATLVPPLLIHRLALAPSAEVTALAVNILALVLLVPIHLRLRAERAVT